MFDGVVVSSIDRIGRGKSAETIAVLDACEKAGIGVWSADDGQENTNIDDESGTREIMRTIKLVAARTERLRTIVRVRNAARQRFDKGYVVSGRTYGYTARRLEGVKANAVMEINPEQAAVVRRVFQAVADGMGYVPHGQDAEPRGRRRPASGTSNADVEKLVREGKPVPVNHWQSTGIRELIMRDLYTGRQPYGQIRRTGPKTRVREPRDKWSWRDVPHLRIVSDELHAAAHARLAATTSNFLRAKGKMMGHPEVTKGKAMLSGFLVCGAPALSPREHGGDICGEPLIASAWGRKGEPVYVCRATKTGKGPGYCGNPTAIPREELHVAVMAAMRKTFSAESFKAHQARLANDTETRRQREAQRVHLTAELPRLQAKAAPASAASGGPRRRWRPASGVPDGQEGRGRDEGLAGLPGLHGAR